MYIERRIGAESIAHDFGVSEKRRGTATSAPGGEPRELRSGDRGKPQLPFLCCGMLKLTFVISAKGEGSEQCRDRIFLCIVCAKISVTIRLIQGRFGQARSIFRVACDEQKGRAYEEVFSSIADANQGILSVTPDQHLL